MCELHDFRPSPLSLCLLQMLLGTAQGHPEGLPLRLDQLLVHAPKELAELVKAASGARAPSRAQGVGDTHCGLHGRWRVEEKHVQIWEGPAVKNTAQSSVDEPFLRREGPTAAPEVAQQADIPVKEQRLCRCAAWSGGTGRAGPDRDSRGLSSGDQALLRGKHEFTQLFRVLREVTPEGARESE